jgi:deoxyribodipyrimidine photolyase-related protein
MPSSPRLLLVLGDQLGRDLLDALRPDPAADLVLMVESPDFVARKPYHRKKVVLVWSAMRHYARELRAEGYSVRYVRIEEGKRLREAVRDAAAEHGAAALACVRPRERGTALGLARLCADLGLTYEEAPDPSWYTAPEEFGRWLETRKQPKLEDYYRWVRQQTGVLMRNREPEGGQWNYDKENRKPFPKAHTPVAPFAVEPDAITREVMGTVSELPGLTGSVDGFASPVTRDDACDALSFFVRELLPRFGPYEDAMSTRDGFGYHSLLSIPLNLSLLTPRECVDAAVTAYRAGDAPLASVEGYVRQVLGWREFMFHMQAHFPGDYHAVNALGHTRPLPAWYWTGDTRMNCLRHVVGRVREHGYSHHIERLMVLGNFALLYGADPHELNDWFWSLYLDAFEWVVTPNVVGMSQFADGGWIATKPYVSSGAYIDRMSDYCKGCPYDPKKSIGEDACPFTTLYWSFLIEHEASPLSQRMTQNLFGLRGKGDEERRAILAQKARLLTMVDEL